MAIGICVASINAWKRDAEGAEMRGTRVVHECDFFKNTN